MEEEVDMQNIRFDHANNNHLLNRAFSVRVMSWRVQRRGYLAINGVGTRSATQSEGARKKNYGLLLLSRFNFKL